jgi:hypothetical protein
MGIVAYGYSFPFLGYYWDDWEVVFLLNAKNAALFTGYFAFDRPFGWPYQVMYAAFGLNPVAWHGVTLLLRWAGILLLYLSLRVVWPRYDSYLRWLGALLLVYPGFLQQSISAAYNRHLTAFFLFALSIYLMAIAVKSPSKLWFLLPLSWLTAFVQIFTIEYFVGLELIRPILLWLLLGPESRNKGGKAVGKVVLLVLPYLLLLGYYFWWRLIVFPTTISRANYAGDFKLLEDFSISFFAGIMAVLTRAVLDLIYSTLQVWLAAVTGPGAFTFQSKIAWFAVAAAAVVAVLFAIFFADGTKSEADERGPLRSFILFGLWAFVVSGLPIWLTSKQLSGGGRWDDRFSLAPMLGAGVLTIALMIWLVRAAQRRIVLGLLLALSISTQILTVNKYRLDWGEQNEYYWQLAWRAPALLPQTAIFSLEQPSASIPGYDASFALNVLFDGNIVDGAVPHWFFTNDRFLNFEFKPGKDIAYKDRNLRFVGNTSSAISIVHQGEDRCLQVLDAVYADEPFYAVGQQQLVGVSDVSRILAASGEVGPSRDIFGPEPPHTWCYYFEKADLARQLRDWDGVLRLDQQARAAGLASKFGPEYLPFIEAYAQTGNWPKALDLSRAAESSISEMQPLLCSTWTRLGKLPTADPVVVQEAKRTFSCSPT